MRRITRPFWTLLAILFLIEAWLWDLVSPRIRWLVGLLPWQRLKTAVANGIAHLPAPLVVFIFILPDLILLPVKLGSLWIIAHGHPVSGMAIFVVAKISGVLLAVFLFEICRPKLMELSWFRWIYKQVTDARAWARHQVEPIKVQIVSAMNVLKTRFLGEKGRILRRMRLIRARIRGQG